MEQERPREHQNVTDYRDRVDTIREVFSYLKQFRGTTFVVRIDNTVLDDPLFSVLVKDISLLHEAGIRVALVPSAKERIDEVLKRYEVQYTVINGVRVTSEEAIPFIKMAEPLSLEVQHFLDCVDSGETPRSDGRDGLRVVRVLEAVDESMALGGAPVATNLEV